MLGVASGFDERYTVQDRENAERLIAASGALSTSHQARIVLSDMIQIVENGAMIAKVLDNTGIGTAQEALSQGYIAFINDAVIEPPRGKDGKYMPFINIQFARSGN